MSDSVSHFGKMDAAPNAVPHAEHIVLLPPLHGSGQNSWQVLNTFTTECWVLPPADDWVLTESEEGHDLLLVSGLGQKRTSEIFKNELLKSSNTDELFVKQPDGKMTLLSKYLRQHKFVYGVIQVSRDVSWEFKLYITDHCLRGCRTFWECQDLQRVLDCENRKGQVVLVELGVGQGADVLEEWGYPGVCSMWQL